MFALDVAAAVLAALFAWGFMWGDSYREHIVDRTGLLSHDLLLGALGLAVVLVLAWGGQYTGRRRLSRVDDSLSLVKAVVIGFTIAIAFAFATNGFGTGFVDYSRRVVVLEVVGLVLFMGFARFATWAWQRRLFRSHVGVRRLLVAGAGASSAQFERFIQERSWLGYTCSGAIRVLDRPTDSEFKGGMVRGAPVLGGIADLPDVAGRVGADEMVVALDADERPQFARLVNVVVGLGLPMRVVPAMFECGYRDACAAGLDGLPVVGLSVKPLHRAQRTAKRVLDVLLAVSVAVVLSPIFAAVALAIMLTSRGSPFYAQWRVGQFGRQFRMYKFRTMYRDAETRWRDLRELHECDAALFKLRDDPRVTPIGRVLRRWSVDEFPQLVNVLKGDMSFVGPRPPLPDEVDSYGTSQLARLKGLPGITGLWQVSGRSDVPFERMVDLDCYYLENWSLGLDVSIVIRTALVVLNRRGAY